MALRKISIVLIALLRLKADQKPAHTEDVAVESFRVSPTLFSWKKYSEQIDLESIRVSLYDLRSERRGRLVQGSVLDGWRLTAKGIREAKKLERMLETLPGPHGQEQLVSMNRNAREIERFKSSSAWQKWRSGARLSSQESAELLRIDEYSSKARVAEKLKQIRLAIGPDEEVRRFVEALGTEALAFLAKVSRTKVTR